MANKIDATAIAAALKFADGVRNDVQKRYITFLQELQLFNGAKLLQTNESMKSTTPTSSTSTLK